MRRVLLGYCKYEFRIRNFRIQNYFSALFSM